MGIGILSAGERADSSARPRHSHGDPTSLAPHERLTDLAVVPREKAHTGAAAREQPQDSPAARTVVRPASRRPPRARSCANALLSDSPQCARRLRGPRRAGCLPPRPPRPGRRSPRTEIHPDGLDAGPPGRGHDPRGAARSPTLRVGHRCAGAACSEGREEGSSYCPCSF